MAVEEEEEANPANLERDIDTGDGGDELLPAGE